MTWICVPNALFVKTDFLNLCIEPNLCHLPQHELHFDMETFKGNILCIEDEVCDLDFD